MVEVVFHEVSCDADGAGEGVAVAAAVGFQEHAVEAEHGGASVGVGAHAFFEVGEGAFGEEGAEHTDGVAF